MVEEPTTPEEPEKKPEDGEQAVDEKAKGLEGQQ